MEKGTIDRLYKAMDGSRGLPALERAVTSILGAMKDENVGSKGLANHVIQDFTLTQKVLKLANSAMYAPFNKDKASVSSALEVLGVDSLLHIALSTAMVSDDDVENDEHLSKTLLASELARNLCTNRTEEASISAMMYDVGRLMVANYLPEDYAAIEKRIASGQESGTAIIEVLGMTIQEIGAEVAKRWKLPAAIVSVIDGTGDPLLVNVASFSSSASTLIHAGNFEGVSRLIADLNIPGVDKSKLQGLIEREATSRSITLQVAVDKPVPEAGSEGALEQILAILNMEKKLTVEDLAGSMFPVFVQALKVAHCLLFITTKSGEFRIRYGQGKGIEELKHLLRISADFKPTAFHAAIKNNVDVVIADVGKLKPTALPESYKTVLPDVVSFLIMPIANSRVSGLLYFDWDRPKVLNQAELLAVRKLRDLFLPFFPR